MKKYYVLPEAELEIFDALDIIAASDEPAATTATTVATTTPPPALTEYEEGAGSDNDFNAW
ncbi:MAG: hypothetical protein IJ038_03770 [Clostridia bacterium]|nr:hypothetical protein [Clostridia bacterium]